MVSEMSERLKMSSKLSYLPLDFSMISGDRLVYTLPKLMKNDYSGEL